MNIVDIMKSALERIAGIEMFHSLDVSMWNNLPLFTKICFVAAGPLLVLPIPFWKQIGYARSRVAGRVWSYRKTLGSEEARRGFDERIDHLLNQHGVDYVRGYGDALKDASQCHENWSRAFDGRVDRSLRPKLCGRSRSSGRFRSPQNSRRNEALHVFLQNLLPQQRCVTIPKRPPQ